jgi:hypothetical protein
VLFDVGGVLVQLSGVATVMGWVADRWTPADVWHRWLHSPAVRAFETGRTDATTFAADLVQELELGVAPALFLESFAGWPTGLYPGAHELVASVPSHITRALLSNSNSLHWPRVEGEFGLGSPDGRRVPLRGVADRIDILDGNRLRVIDYKTGSAPNPRRALQVPIYALSSQEREDPGDGPPMASPPVCGAGPQGVNVQESSTRWDGHRDHPSMAPRRELFDLPSMITEAAERAGLIQTDRCVALLVGASSRRLLARPSTNSSSYAAPATRVHGLS